VVSYGNKRKIDGKTQKISQTMIAEIGDE